jgi:hypothetical protein
VVILLLVPLQAAAEEYIFRGYLMQSIGRWLRHPAFAILLPVPLFVLGTATTCSVRSASGCSPSRRLAHVAHRRTGGGDRPARREQPVGFLLSLPPAPIRPRVRRVVSFCGRSC